MHCTILKKRHSQSNLSQLLKTLKNVHILVEVAINQYSHLFVDAGSQEPLLDHTLLTGLFIMFSRQGIGSALPLIEIDTHHSPSPTVHFSEVLIILT